MKFFTKECVKWIICIASITYICDIYIAVHLIDVNDSLIKKKENLFYVFSGKKYELDLIESFHSILGRIVISYAKKQIGIY